MSFFIIPLGRSSLLAGKNKNSFILTEIYFFPFLYFGVYLKPRVPAVQTNNYDKIYQISIICITFHLLIFSSWLSSNCLGSWGYEIRYPKCLPTLRGSWIICLVIHKQTWFISSGNLPFQYWGNILNEEGLLKRVNLRACWKSEKEQQSSNNVNDFHSFD